MLWLPRSWEAPQKGRARGWRRWRERGPLTAESKAGDLSDMPRRSFHASLPALGLTMSLSGLPRIPMMKIGPEFECRSHRRCPIHRFPSRAPVHSACNSIQSVELYRETSEHVQNPEPPAPGKAGLTRRQRCSPVSYLAAHGCIPRHRSPQDPTCASTAPPAFVGAVSRSSGLRLSILPRLT